MRVIHVRNIQPGQKTAVVIRYGAWGDAVLISPILRLLSEDGHHVTLNCTERCFDILKTNPYVDRFWLQETNEVPIDKLGDYWKAFEKHFDKTVNLSGSIEGRLLKTPSQPEYNWPKEERHKVCNKNYMDQTLEIAGYLSKSPVLPELHFREKEERWARKVREKHPGFLVVVSLSGSSIHKIYPWMDSVVGAIEKGIPDSHILLVGEGGCRGIIDETSQVTDLCGNLGIRKTFCLLKYADLVISTETSVANAASAFDTPKVVILSHSTEENLTRDWKNCKSVFESVSCYPCHQLHYTKQTCKLDEKLELPICAVLLTPKKVIDAVQTFYEKYQETKRLSHT